MALWCGDGESTATEAQTLPGKEVQNLEHSMHHEERTTGDGHGMLERNGKKKYENALSVGPAAI